jgi:two-component system sensor histidine kinase/response regulator
LAAGGVDYLPKPIRAKEALARIRTHLQIRRVAGRAAALLVDQLSKANAAKNRFLGMAAHDLRNPLASIRGLAEFMRDGVVGEPLTPSSSTSSRPSTAPASQMLVLVNELLDVATIEAGELKLKRPRRPTWPRSSKRPSTSPTSRPPRSRRRSRSLPATADRRPAPPRPEQDPAGRGQSAQQRGEVLAPGLDHHRGRSNRERLGSVRRRPGQGPGIPESERHKLFKDFGRTVGAADRRREEHRPGPRHLPQDRGGPPRHHHGGKPARPRLRFPRHPPP